MRLDAETQPGGDSLMAHSLVPESGTADPSATVPRHAGAGGMTKSRAVAYLGMNGGGWTEHTTAATNLISLADVLFNAFSKLRRLEGRCSANLDSSDSHPSLRD